MSALWVNLFLSAAAFLVQFHVLPVWGMNGITPDLLLSACAVGSMFFGAAWALPFAFLFGMASDLLLGYGYGMYLLPMVICAFLGQYLSSMSFERPYLAALFVGIWAFLARVLRLILMMGAGHGAFPGANDLLWAAGTALTTAVCALIMIYGTDRWQRAGKSGRYDS